MNAIHNIAVFNARRRAESSGALLAVLAALAAMSIVAAVVAAPYVAAFLLILE